MRDYLHRIGDACYKYRTARARTVREAAKAIGISAATYNRVELAEKDMSLKTFWLIVDWLGVDASELLFGERT